MFAAFMFREIVCHLSILMVSHAYQTIDRQINSRVSKIGL